MRTLYKAGILERVVFTLFFVIVFSFSYAGNEISNARKEGSNPQTGVVPGMVIQVVDNKYPVMAAGNFSSLFTNHHSEGRLIAGVDWESPVLPANDYDYTLRFNIEYQYWNGSSFVTQSINGVDLRVEFNNSNSNAVNDYSVYRVLHVSGVYKVRATLMNVYNTSNLNTPIAGWTNPGNLYVEAEQHTERYYPFNLGFTPTSVSHRYLAATDELEVYWDYITGAEEYDLEWTYVDNYDKPLSSLTYDFKNNATRVTVSGNSYTFPVIFEQGYVLYRIRGVGRGSIGFSKKLFGRWSSDQFAPPLVQNFGNKYQVTQTHQHNLNWQFTAGYAEEGKSKRVVDYADGSLRSRQVVTKQNSHNQALVGEIIYDHQGRTAINVLPVPVHTQNPAIRYYDGFNKNVAYTSSINNATVPEGPYDRRDFDLDPTPGSCAESTVGMSTTNGASKYYSPANQLHQPWKRHQDYVPDAQLYPFTQVEYQPDNTNRIRRQSGVGIDYRLGTGHETKNFYGQPHQKELDRLFGSEAGYSSHYQKNLVQDANGQVTVTYLDMQGRVVASALAGDAPVSSVTGQPVLEPLTTTSPTPGEIVYQPEVSMATGSMHIDLLNKDNPSDPDDEEDNNMRISGNSLVLSSQFLVDANNKTHTFTYDLKGAEYEILCGVTNFCYDCIYELTISVKDQCGNYVQYTTGTGSNQTPAADLHIGPILVGAKDVQDRIVIDSLCTAGSNNYPGTSGIQDFTAVLNTGVYTIEKRLSIHSPSEDAYLANFIADGEVAGCVISLDSMIADALDDIDFSGCDITCASCDSVILKAIADGDLIINSPEHILAVNECEALCTPEVATLCSSRYQMMLSDMSPQISFGGTQGQSSPSGQYGEVELVNGQYTAAAFPLSIYNPDNALPDNTSPPAELWRNSQIMLENDFGVMVPSTDASITLTHFINQWDESWAQYLVLHHPEYCYYTWCSGNANDNSAGFSSEEFDVELQRVDFSLNPANHLMPGTTTYVNFYNPLASDPYFQSGGQGAGQYQAMLNKMNVYHVAGNNTFNIWQYASLQANCGSVYGGTAAMISCLNAANPGIVYPAGGMNLIDTEAEWDIFKNMYFAQKQRFQEFAADLNAIGSGSCYGGCIGAGDQLFNSVMAPLFYWGNINSPFFSHDQPCGIFTLIHYLNKTRRFGNANDHLPENSDADVYGDPEQLAEELSSQANFEIYSQTGQCPLAIDLQGFLGSMATSGRLFTPNPVALNNAGGFTYAMYQAVQGVAGITWQGTLNGNQVTGSFSTGCSITLTAPSTIPWNNIRVMTGLMAVSGNSNAFTVTVYFNPPPGSTVAPPPVTLSGTTCFPLTGCTFADVCEANEATADLQALMSMLAADGHLADNNNGLGYSLTAFPYQQVFSQNLQALLGNGSVYTWHGSTSGNFYIRNAALVNVLSITLPGYGSLNPAPHHFSGIRISSTPGNFRISAVTINPETITRIFNCTAVLNTTAFTGPMPMGNCHPPVPMACQSDENMNRVHLENFLDALAATHDGLDDGNTVGLMGVPQFSSSLQAGLGSATPILQWFADVDVDAHSPVFTGTIATSRPGTILCTVSLSTGNSLNGPYNFGYNNNYATYFSSITAFDNLQADNTHMVGGQFTYHFTVTAHFANGNTEVLEGQSCWAIANCSKCPGGDDVAVNLGPSFGAGIRSLPDMPGYIYYTLLAQALGGNFGAVGPQSLAPAADACTPGTFSITDNAQTQCSPTFPYTGVSHDDPGTGSFVLCNINSSTGKVLAAGAFTVQPNTDYVFEAWVMDAMNTQRSSNPMVNFLIMPIGGTYVSENRYIPVDPGVWRQEYITWNSGAATHVYIAIAGSTGGSKSMTIGLDHVRFYKQCKPWIPGTIPPLQPYINPCYEELELNAIANATEEHENYLVGIETDFRTAYKSKCLEAIEQFTADYQNKEYHHILYYYDLAGNLIKTVPPKGVQILSDGMQGRPPQLLSQSIPAARNAHTVTAATLPNHKFETVYVYNSLNQLVMQSTPDTRVQVQPFENGDGRTRYWYDKLGRIILSQNSEQAIANGNLLSYSYTRYDALGKVVETGELHTGIDMVYLANNSYQVYYNIINPSNPASFPATMLPQSKTEVTRNYYNSGDSWQQNLRGRIAKSTTEAVDDGNDATYDYASRYSYDIHGNVNILKNENKLIPTPGQQEKTITYTYDLISGNVNKAVYQQGAADQFIHRYEYDADNRITNVYTSQDNICWDQDAKYFYYDHGPLARVELGHHKVQGQDYAYTATGLMKGVNGNRLTADNDIGKDASSVLQGNINRNTGKDLYGFTLGYYENDYKAVHVPNTSPGYFEALLNGTGLMAARNDLYNGNLSYMTNAVQGITNPISGMAFKYDQTNRLKSSVFALYNTPSSPGAWEAPGTDYATEYSYDGNGNILTLKRNANTSNNAMDDLVYHYKPGNNQLLSVNDQVSADAFGTDIEAGQALNNNYIYSKTGNLVHDEQEQIEKIEWSNTGKIKSVTRKSGSIKDDLVFQYDPNGMTVAKIAKPHATANDPTTWTYTYYTHDATGNIMAVHERDINHGLNSNQFEETTRLVEQPVYGSSRVGTNSPNKLITNTTFTATLNTNGVFSNVNYGFIGTSVFGSYLHNMSGGKRYELNDHLSNVMATVGDKIKIEDTSNDHYADGYSAFALSISSYYPFGMQMPDRELTGSYRYGYNGKERYSELSREVYDFGARLYDSRIGRWYAVDAKAYMMPGCSPYGFALNNPMILVDADGKIPKPSEILADFGIKTAPMIAGLMDGFVSGLGFLEAGEMAYKLATDPSFRDEMIETFKTIASDPLGFAATIANDYKEKAKNILAGNAEGQYAMGEIVGELVGGAITGAASLKLIKFAKVFKQSKLVQKTLANKPCGCFTSGTLVLTSKGYVAIDEIVVGDSVYAFSDSLNRIDLKVVTETLTRTFTEYFKVYFGNTVLSVTHEHPFLINGKWIKAEELRTGDELTSLVTEGNVTYSIDSIVFYKNQEELKVYNLIIEDYHTYYVSEGNVLVHNGSPCKLTKYFGFDKVHNSPAHFDIMRGFANKLKGQFDEIYGNRALSTVLGKKGLGKFEGSNIEDLRPDVVAISGKKVHLIEVVSEKQSISYVEKKLAAMKEALTKAGYEVTTDIDKSLSKTK